MGRWVGARLSSDLGLFSLKSWRCLACCTEAGARERSHALVGASRTQGFLFFLEKHEQARIVSFICFALGRGKPTMLLALQ